jgi:hypothetical protein
MLYLKQAIILCQALGLSDRSYFNKFSSPPHRQIRQPIVLRLSAPGTHGHLPSGCSGREKSFPRFGDGTDLVDLQKEDVSSAGFDCAPNSGRICTR